MHNLEIDDEEESSRYSILVPRGALAASFYWYENEPELYGAEIEAMRRFFPRFQLQKERDGRLSWLGQVTPGLIANPPRTYTLHLVYDHDHPHNNSYGGSVKVYCIDPDLEEIARGTFIPHTLRDSRGHLYICTAASKDVKVGTTVGSTVTTGASALAWAVKWIVVFELWLNNTVSDEQFKSHVF